MCVDEQSKNLKCIFTVNPEKESTEFVNFGVVEITTVTCVILVSCKCHLRSTSTFSYAQKKKREGKRERTKERGRRREGNRKGGIIETSTFYALNNQNKLFSIYYKQ